MNKQYGVEDSKYVVICDASTLGYVIRRMRIAPKNATNKIIIIIIIKSCKVNRQYGVGDPNMWLFVTPLPWVT